MYILFVNIYIYILYMELSLKTEIHIGPDGLGW